MFIASLALALTASIAGVQAAPSATTPIPHTLFARDEHVRIDDDAPVFDKRAPSCTFPSPPKTSTISAPISVTGVFDGGNVRFDRGSGSCEDGEGDDEAAVFLIQAGGTIQNVVIGKDQMEGIHCMGPCNVYNVWFEDVCEDAITIKQSSGTSNIIGGGAKGGSDKIVQHNGGGLVNIDSYCVQTFGKLYRSCGNCKSGMTKRMVNIGNIIASSGSVLAGINSNYGDVATINTSTAQLSSVKSICDTYQGNDTGAEPKKLTSNTANSNCVFGAVSTTSKTSTTTSKTSTTTSKTSTTTTKTSTTKTSTSSQPTSTGQAPLYGQCGGASWDGPTDCVPPAVCKYSNEWYSQCINE